jgi:hypothetical protein
MKSLLCILWLELSTASVKVGRGKKSDSTFDGSNFRFDSTSEMSELAL